MSLSRTARTTSTKPVNINISFTINPKNIVNQQAASSDNAIKNKKIMGLIQGNSAQKQVIQHKPRTPDLPNTDRIFADRDNPMQLEEHRDKRSRKRNSVDDNYMNFISKKAQTLNFQRGMQLTHARKSSGKSKKQSEMSTTRKHQKTYSKHSVVEYPGLRNTGIEGLTLQQKGLTKKYFKNAIDRIITNELSKRSLPLELPTQQNRTARKKKISTKKHLKQGKSLNLIRRQSRPEQNQSIDRKMIIDKLTSLRSINNSLFMSEQDEQIHRSQRRAIIINTDQSMQGIEQIHQLEKAARVYQRLDNQIYEIGKANETKNIIENYIAILNEQIQYEGEHYEGENSQDEEQQEQMDEEVGNRLEEEFDKFREQDIRLSLGQYFGQSGHVEDRPNVHKQKEKERNSLLQPFCSSQMTKQQKMISEIERVKLTELKKHEVQKWGELLTFIKQSMKQGKADHDQILTSIYSFLQQTKASLQKEISKDPAVQKDGLEQFTNKFSSNQMVTKNQPEELIEQANQFNEISSMSFRDEDYQEQNQQLKLMNLEMIQSALKARHETLLDKMDREMNYLEEKRNARKLTEKQYLQQKEKLEKWTRKETTEIMQARKNIWKGYNQAKGIIEKSLRSKQFQEQSAKKKSMMKCLSEDYLLKNYNYKKLLKPAEQDQPQQQEEEQEEEEQEFFESQVRTLDVSAMVRQDKNFSKNEMLQSHTRTIQVSAFGVQKINKHEHHTGQSKAKIKQKAHPQNEQLLQSQVTVFDVNSQIKKQKQPKKPKSNHDDEQNLILQSQVKTIMVSDFRSQREDQLQPQELHSQVEYGQAESDAKQFDYDKEAQLSNQLSAHKSKQQLYDNSQDEGQVQSETEAMGGMVQNYKDNQFEQLKQLTKYDDIGVIQQKLQNYKEKHLPQEAQNVNKGVSDDSAEVSYEQVDNQLKQQSVSDEEMMLINRQMGKQKKNQAILAEQYDRLRHILPQDKDDIFEFIFLDLSIELYQEPCHNNRIMDCINKYISYMKKQVNKKKGVKTNLNVVKQYLKRFVGFITRAHKNVLKTLDEPVGPTAIQMLKYMHENEDDPVQCQQPPSPLVIPSSVFDMFEKSLLPSIEFDVYYQHDEEKENKRVQFLKNVLHIHNKALFDALNEYLDLLRPFGIWGKPFPWKSTPSFVHVTNDQQKQDKLKKATEKVIQYCSFVCGLLVDKQQSLVGNAKLSEDYLQQIKQDRLSRMLATELVQNEQRWLFYDDEQTQVLVQISTAIHIIMLKEATHQILQIRNKRILE